MIARGSVTGVAGGMLEARIPGAAIGDGIRILHRHGSVDATVCALRDDRALLAAQGATDRLAAGDAAYTDRRAITMLLGTSLLGRAVDANGGPLDGLAAPRGRRRPLRAPAPQPGDRTPVERPFWTGVRVIDGLLTLGCGVRAGIFGPPGAGKSTLLHAIVAGSQADAIVVGLVGERGREAEEWMREAPAHATTVCATSDRSAAERVRAGHAAMAQAEALRSRGLNVLLVLDSLARFASALRESAAAAGEPAGRAGYPPSVFAEMARFVERAGTARSGSITMLATVLSDGDERDPVSDAARSLLDGHIQLSAALAHAGHFPAIDVPASASRSMATIASGPHAANASVVRSAVAALSRSEDARALGVPAADPFTQRAAAAEPELEAFLRQDSAPTPPERTLSILAGLADTLR